jgi:cell division protein FtsL
MTALPSRDFQKPVYDTTIPHPRRISAKATVSQQQRLFASSTKLGVYLLLSILGITSLTNLVVYSMNQQSKLYQLKSEVKDAKQRLATKNADFQYSFDPRVTKSLMEENSYRVAKDKLPIVPFDAEEVRR